jgi:hypothetical protein
LLLEDFTGKAWRHHGFEKQPIICGPDAARLASLNGVELANAASLIVGGGHLNGFDFSMIGAFRVFNPTTGKGPDADEGFAVKTTSIVRNSSSPLDQLVEFPFRLAAYLEAPGAVRRGRSFSRREVIDYFANHAGGVHLDRVAMAAKADKVEIRQTIAELEQRIQADTIDGLYFELLSIGQAVGRSADMQRLENAIRADSAGTDEGASPAVSGPIVIRLKRGSPGQSE